MNIEKKRTAKDKIIDAAWKLFKEQGYDGTTINEIIAASGTSRGAFYHNFRGKEDLMFCMAYFFDDEYDKWLEALDSSLHSIDKLIALDAYVLSNLEDSEYRPFFPKLYGMQVMTESTRHILNPERKYYQIVNAFMKEGLVRGEIKSELPYQELAEYFIIIERGFVYDWCLNKFRYSLLQYGQRIIKLYLDSLRA
ncbi:MAG: TetR/AcrR family transcriptional regulator [Lachnospiraceae bacterium]